MHVQVSITSENKEKGTLRPMTTALVSRLQIVTGMIYSTDIIAHFLLVGSEDMKKFLFFSVQILKPPNYFSRLGRCQPKPKPRDFESVRQTNQILTFVSAAGDLMTKLYYVVYQNPQKILSLKISSVKGKDHSYV